jgi:hypothetical protein
MRRTVSRFWAGFGVASLLWGALVVYLWLAAGLATEETVPVPVAPSEPAAPGLVPADDARRARMSKRARPRTEATPEGFASSGDLGEDELRVIDGEGQGGERQLSPAQIEAGFDSAMGRIRRCLVLMAGGDPVRGTVTFALRVAPSGQVRAVQLHGPAAASTGEAGECLRGSARSIRFDSFDGPEMVVRYPLHLE